MSFSLELKNGKILNKQNLWKLNQALFLKLVTTNVHKKKKQNDPLSAVAMTTVLPLVLSQ